MGGPAQSSSSPHTGGDCSEHLVRVGGAQRSSSFATSFSLWACISLACALRILHVKLLEVPRQTRPPPVLARPAVHAPARAAVPPNCPRRQPASLPPRRPPPAGTPEAAPRSAQAPPPRYTRAHRSWSGRGEPRAAECSLRPPPLQHHVTCFPAAPSKPTASLNLPAPASASSTRATHTADSSAPSPPACPAAAPFCGASSSSPSTCGWACRSLSWRSCATPACPSQHVPSTPSMSCGCHGAGAGPGLCG